MRVGTSVMANNRFKLEQINNLSPLKEINDHFSKNYEKTSFGFLSSRNHISIMIPHNREKNKFPSLDIKYLNQSSENQNKI